MLVLVTFQDDVPPWLCYHEVRKGACRLGVKATRFEWEVVLVFELDTSFLQLLVEQQLLLLGQCLWVA